MRAIKLSVLAVIMFTVCITSVKAQTADEILEKHVAAMGGLDNWNKLKTVKMSSSWSIQGMDIPVVRTYAVGKAMRTDINAMGMNGFIILTPNSGYMYLPFQGQTKVDTMKADAVAALQSQLDIVGEQLIDYKAKGYKTELAGKDSVNNMLCYKVKITDKNGTESMAYIDAVTYYLMRMEAKVKFQDQEQELASTYNNYKKVDGGVVMPMNATDQQGEITNKSIDINKPVDDNIFIPAIQK